MSRLKKYLSKEIGIEFKAGLNFYAILLFYSLYRIGQGSFSANIIIMAEMIFVAYGMGYVQVYLLGNFDEEEQFGVRTGLSSLFCSVLYTVTSFLLHWFDQNVMATVMYFLYMLFCYVCMFLVYKIKRDIETELLNEELEQFKKRKG